MPFYPVLGRVPLLKEKKGTLILTSLLEDPAYHVTHFEGECG